MESFKFKDHDIKAEKENAISKYYKVEKMTKVFRFLEISVFLIILFRFFTQLPFAHLLSDEYLRGICVTLFTPRFVFLIGNAIILVLVYKSGKLSGEKSETTDFYDEYMEKCRRNQLVSRPELVKPIVHIVPRECHTTEKARVRMCIQGRELVNAVCEYDRSKEQRSRRNQLVSGQELVKPVVQIMPRGFHEGEKVRVNIEGRELINDVCVYNRPKLPRSRSETHLAKETHRELRRSTTERCRKIRKKAASAIAYAEDEMSNEEFRRKIEAFIARQQKCLREEEFTIFTYDET